MSEYPSRSHFPFTYRWNNDGRQGQRCRVLAVGTMYACLVEFPDGFKMVSTVNAVKKDILVASDADPARNPSFVAEWWSGKRDNQLD
jgi:hypothetical protein